MVCPKCGNNVNDTIGVCPNCGWYEKESYKQSENDNFIEQRNNSSEIYHEESDASEFDFNQNENEFNNDNQIIVQQPKQKNSLVMMLVIAFSVICIAIGIGCAVYFNSNSYKIEKATEYILCGQYSEAVDKLSNVYVPQADILRAYIDILQYKDDFINSFDSTVLINSEHRDILENADDFKFNLYNFKEEQSIYLLPESLRKQFDYYYDCCKNIDSVLYKEGDSVYNLYYSPQLVFTNRPTRNRVDSFTLRDMQAKVNSSQEAVDSLNDWITMGIEDFSNAEYKFENLNSNDAPYELSYFCSYTNDFISSCKDEIETEQGKINEDLKRFDIDDSLHLKEPNSEYVSYVMFDLVDVADISDVGENATIFENTYYVDMLAYCLNNE